MPGNVTSRPVVPEPLAENLDVAFGVVVDGGDRLTSDVPPTGTMRTLLVRPARGQWLRLTVRAFVKVGGIGGVVETTDTIFSRQPEQRLLGEPDQLSGDVAFTTTGADLEMVSVFQKRWVLLENANLECPFWSERHLRACPPLTDGEVLPVIAMPVARRAATEDEVFEVAGKLAEGFWPEAADAVLKLSVQHLLLEHELSRSSYQYRGGLCRQ